MFSFDCACARGSKFGRRDVDLNSSISPSASHLCSCTVFNEYSEVDLSVVVRLMQRKPFVPKQLFVSSVPSHAAESVEQTCCLLSVRSSDSATRNGTNETNASSGTSGQIAIVLGCLVVM